MWKQSNQMEIGATLKRVSEFEWFRQVQLARLKHHRNLVWQERNDKVIAKVPN
jgi:hypothetical protein